MNENKQEEVEIDLRELFFVLFNKIGYLISAGIIGAVIALLYTILLVTPMYSSTSSLYILSKTTALTSLTDIQLGTQLTQDYMVLAKSRTVVEEVIEELDLDMTYKEFLNNVSISNEDNTRILTFTVTNADPYMAKTIVDKYADVTAEKTAEIMDTAVPNVVDTGTVEKNPVSPNTTKNVVMGGLILCVAAAGIIIIMYLADDSVKGADDVEKYLGLTNLGSIPIYGDEKRSKHIRKHKKLTKKAVQN